MKLSRFSSLLEESPTRMIDRVMEERGLSREEVIMFSSGQPGVSPPEWVLERLVERLKSGGLGVFGYTPSGGRRRLRELVALDLAEFGGLDVSWRNVVITAGGQEAMYAVLASILDSGGEVVVFRPMYFGYWSLLRLFYSKTIVVEERLEEGFQPPVERVQELVARGRTRAIILVSPDNPTGRVIGEKEARALAEIALEAGAWLVLDEAYRTIVLEGGGNPPLYNYAPEAVIGVGAFSKDPGIPGWRLGYVYAVEPVAERIRLASEKIVYCPPLPAQLLVEAYLEDSEGKREFRRMITSVYRERRDAMISAIERYLPKARLYKPRGSMFMYLDLGGYLSAIGLSSREFSERLLGEKRVAVIPGEFFERRVSYRVRLNFTAEPVERIEAGVARMAELLEDIGAA